MRRLKFWIRNFFGFSSVEANGFLVLLPLILLAIFSQPLIVHFFYDTKPPNVNDLVLDSLIRHWNFNPEFPDQVAEEITLFQFDPNTATVDELLALGFPSFLANRVANYREKGGHFYEPKDLLKIYGMDSSRYNRLAPYINMAPPPRKSAPRPKFEKKQTYDSPELFDLNLADTSKLRTIRGIGPVLALRIIKFRERLGGFVNPAQLYQVYGLDSTVIAKLNSASYIESAYVPSQININEATEKELGNHPYINYKLAKSIATYRFQHGNFSEIDDLLKIDVIDSALLEKIRPYIITEN